MSTATPGPCPPPMPMTGSRPNWIYWRRWWPWNTAGRPWGWKFAAACGIRKKEQTGLTEGLGTAFPQKGVPNIVPNGAFTFHVTGSPSPGWRRVPERIGR
jgi:hypothetical protein